MSRKRRVLSSTSKPKVFGAGLVALDIVISADPATPIRTWAGGTCGNVLTILSYLGWDAYPIARLNREPVAERLKADLLRWGVHLDHIAREPVVDAPIIVQEIRKKKDGTPSHRFHWACLHCGHWLPSYRSITLSAIRDEEIVSNGGVFFFDRVSPATLRLAKSAASAGAIVVFEPSARTDEQSLQAALTTTHILKYADQRMKFESSRRPSPSVLMEVKTMGPRGLMYRSWLTEAKTPGWVHLPAVVAPILADTCGSGDWCTAGIIAKIAGNGIDALRAMKAAELRAGLRYGQALAAWNCGFEGARGGMYIATRSQFEREADELLAGNTETFAHSHSQKHEHQSAIRCPACAAAS